jgi:type VI secretion system protein VasG
VVDFKSTVILLTSNVGSELCARLMADPEGAPCHEGLAEALRPELVKVFKPAFLGRLVVVPYVPIADAVMSRIVRLQLDRIGRRIAENHHASFHYDDALVSLIVGRCTEVSSGARNVDQILTRTVLPALSRQFLAHMAKGKEITDARVCVDDAGTLLYVVA